METVTPSLASSLGRASLSASRAAAQRPLVARTATVRAAASRSLGRQLERDRLDQRAMRVRQVIHVLRERAAARDTGRTR